MGCGAEAHAAPKRGASFTRREPRPRQSCATAGRSMGATSVCVCTSAALLPLSRSKLDRVKIYVYRPTGSTERCATEGATNVPPHTTLGTDDERTEYIVRSTRTETPKQGAGGRANRNKRGTRQCTLCCWRERGGEYAKYMQSPQSASRYTLAPVHCRSTATTECRVWIVPPAPQNRPLIVNKKTPARCCLGIPISFVIVSVLVAFFLCVPCCA